VSAARSTASDRLPERGARSVSRARIGCSSLRLSRRHPAPAVLVAARRRKALHPAYRIWPADKRCTLRSVSRFSSGSRMSVRRLDEKGGPSC